MIVAGCSGVFCYGLLPWRKHKISPALETEEDGGEYLVQGPIEMDSWTNLKIGGSSEDGHLQLSCNFGAISFKNSPSSPT